MAETNQQTNITVSGKLTVTIHLKDSQRYGTPSMQIEIPINFGGRFADILETLERSTQDIRRRLLIACGKGEINE